MLLFCFWGCVSITKRPINNHPKSFFSVFSGITIILTTQKGLGKQNNWKQSEVDIRETTKPYWIDIGISFLQ